MLIFVDESGDPGLKIGQGSSKYFIVALVGFDNHDEAQAADDRISLLKKEQGLSENFEFHFANLKPAHRRLFLATIASYDFFYFGIVVNKIRLLASEFTHQESFYNFACGLIFENAKDRLVNAKLTIDGRASRVFRHQLKNYLRRLADNAEERIIRKVITQDSNRNNLLQLADLVVGSIARSYSGKKDAGECRDIIRHREIDVQLWPK